MDAEKNLYALMVIAEEEQKAVKEMLKGLSAERAAFAADREAFRAELKNAIANAEKSVEKTAKNLAWKHYALSTLVGFLSAIFVVVSGQILFHQTVENTKVVNEKDLAEFLKSELIKALKNEKPKKK